MRSKLHIVCHCLTASVMLFLAAPPAIAQSQSAGGRRLSLQDAIERARREHPLIIAAKQRAAMAEAEKLEAGMRPNPTLTLSGENFPLGSTQNEFNFGQSIDWFATYSQTFETAGKRKLRVSFAERNLEAAQAEASFVERRITYEVKAAYSLVTIARLRVALLGENLNNLNQLVGLNETRVREGYTAEGDLIKVKLESQRIEFQTRKASLEYDRAKIELLRAIGASSFENDDLSFEIVEELDYQPVLLDAVSLQEAAMRLPQVQVAQAHLERAQALLRLEQARSRPDIVTSIGYKRNGPDNTMYGALSVPLPIYNRNKAQIARAEADVQAAQAELRHSRNLVSAELAAARRAVEMNQKQVESLRADFLLRADESRSISLAAYREGAADLIVLLDAQRVRNQAQEFYFQALHDYQLSIYELERAAGIEQLPRRTSSVKTAQKFGDGK